MRRRSIHPVRVTYHECPERQAEINALAEARRCSFAEAQRFINQMGLDAVRAGIAA